MPLIDTLPLEERLASYLPEVLNGLGSLVSMQNIMDLLVIMRLQGQWTPEDILELLQSPPFRQQVDSFTYV